MGCQSGMQNEHNGCYGDCYAAKSAKLYGYDFSMTVLRYFENRKHETKIVNQINKIPLDFVRIGTMGDPSENWEHCISIIKVIQRANKEIVIITKHWTILTDEQLEYLKTVNVCFNTSVSALDKPHIISRALEQFNRIKKYCKSLLRIVSCDFNLQNQTGLELSVIQKSLFKNSDVIDTILRVNKNNPLAKLGVINIKPAKFLGKKTHISKYNKKTYFGKCSTCTEMCGVRIDNPNYAYTDKRFLIKQQTLF